MYTHMYINTACLTWWCPFSGAFITYIFGLDHLILDNLSVASSLEKTDPPSLSGY